MAYAPTRSTRGELNEGMTDGKYKKVIQNRGGFPEPSTWRERVDLEPAYYGIHEDDTKVRPDLVTVRTPNSVTTPPTEAYPVTDSGLG